MKVRGIAWVMAIIACVGAAFGESSFRVQGCDQALTVTVDLNYYRLYLATSDSTKDNPKKAYKLPVQQNCVGNIIRYARCHDGMVWLVTRLARRYDAAVLINPKTDRLERQYVGLAFSVSPDGDHIAYMENPSAGSVVYCDGGVVYSHGETPAFETRNSVVLSRYGTTSGTLNEWPIGGRKDDDLVPNATWWDGTRLSFLLSREDAETEKKSYFHGSVLVSGKYPDTKITPPEISPLTDDDAQAIIHRVSNELAERRKDIIEEKMDLGASVSWTKEIELKGFH